MGRECIGGVVLDEFNRFEENAGPYAYVQYTPGQPISTNNPNEGSFKRRNAKKRIGQRRAFILVCLDFFLPFFKKFDTL